MMPTSGSDGSGTGGVGPVPCSAAGAAAADGERRGSTRTLVVVAHPDPGSLTAVAATQLQLLLGEADAQVADLSREGFDPRFSTDDRDVYRGRAQGPSADVAAEQARVDAVDHLVLVFPVYWWSMPALLKGWVDRVFVGGWAFDEQDGEIVPRLQRLTVHLLPVSGTSEAAFARHGYAAAFGTQIEHGLIDYCGARRGATAFVHDSESGDHGLVAAAVATAVSQVAAAVREGHDDHGRRSSGAAVGR